MPDRLTDAQRRALLWLPGDGAWTTKLDRSVSAAVDSLSLYHRTLIEVEWRKSPRGGYRLCLQYRLTPAGIARRAQEESKTS